MSDNADRTVVSSSLSETGLLVAIARRARSTESIIERYGAIGETVNVASAEAAESCPRRWSSDVA